MKHGFIQVGAATPAIRVGDVGYNTGSILSAIREAEAQGVQLLVLPELCLTGSTCGDLFFQQPLLEAARRGLERICRSFTGAMAVVLGMPLEIGGSLVNAAVVLQSGRILGIIPRVTADSRYFSLPRQTQWTMLNQQVPVGNDLLFSMTELPQFTFGVEVGRDSQTAQAPSMGLAAAGATVIACPWAWPATAGSRGPLYRGVGELAQRLHIGYILSAAGEGESTSEGVYTGESMIAEGRQILTQAEQGHGLICTQLDVQLLHILQRRAAVSGESLPEHRLIPFSAPIVDIELTRTYSPTPFLPQAEAQRGDYLEETLRLQALGLSKRIAHTGTLKLVLGLSGGLDSTLAALVCARALDLAGKSRRDLVAVTMPCFGTTERTQSSADLLSECLGAELRVVDIRDAVNQHFDDIGHARDNRNVVYENAQARERTQVLMDIANQVDGLVIGTGDMSELALGWCTFGGDQLSMYGVNASIPKTLARQLVAHVRDTTDDETLVLVLDDILETPISPELLPPEDGEIVQQTEEIVGPYELHDFFLYHSLAYGFSPEKILRLAEIAFRATYSRISISRWLTLFYRRLFSQQFKRTSMPEGPAVGPLSLSPRGGFCLPGDTVGKIWLDEAESLR